jgi:hypothetical protein
VTGSTSVGRRPIEAPSSGERAIARDCVAPHFQAGRPSTRGERRWRVALGFVSTGSEGSAKWADLLTDFVEMWWITPFAFCDFEGRFLYFTHEYKTGIRCGHGPPATL